MGACFEVPLSNCLPWVHVIDQYLVFRSDSASELGIFQLYFVAKTFPLGQHIHPGGRESTPPPVPPV